MDSTLRRVDTGFSLFRPTRYSYIAAGHLIVRVRSDVPPPLHVQMSLLVQGSLPQGLGLLTSLEMLSLAHNELCGSIPDDCLSSPSLVSVDLSFNKLEGKVRRTFCWCMLYFHTGSECSPWRFRFK